MVKATLKVIVLLSLQISAIGFILMFAYMRIWLITDDPWDPLRLVSVNMLWIACLLFLASAAFAACCRE
jgi:hypothetical protein